MSRILNNLTIIGTSSFNNSLILGNDVNGYSIYQYGTQSNYFNGSLYLVQNQAAPGISDGLQAYTNASFNKLSLNADMAYSTAIGLVSSAYDESIIKMKLSNRLYSRVQLTGTASVGDTFAVYIASSTSSSVPVITLGTYTFSATYSSGGSVLVMSDAININYLNTNTAFKFYAQNGANGFCNIVAPIGFTQSTSYNIYATWSTTNTFAINVANSNKFSYYYDSISAGDFNQGIRMGISSQGASYFSLLGLNIPYITFVNSTGTASSTDPFITPNYITNIPAINNLGTITTLSNVLYLYGTASTIGTTLKTSLFSATNTNSISLTTNDNNIGVTAGVNLNLLNISNAAFVPNSGTTSFSLLKLAPNIAQSNIAGSVSSSIASGFTRAIYVSPTSLGNPETRGTSTFTVTNIGTIGSTVSFYGNNILLGTYSIASGVTASEIVGIASSINSNSVTTGFQVLATSSSTFIITAPVGSGVSSQVYPSAYISSVGGPTFSLSGAGLYSYGANAGTASNWRTIQDDSWLGYSYYQSSSTAKNYFAGKVLYGTTATDGALVQINGSVSIYGNLSIKSTITDINGLTGPVGYVLTATGNGVAWAQLGAQGPTGPSGSITLTFTTTGITGSQGPIGPQGTIGPQGATGPSGVSATYSLQQVTAQGNTTSLPIQVGGLQVIGTSSFSSYIYDSLGKTGSSGYVLSATGNGIIWLQSSGVANSFIQNGNSFGSVATLGTNDNYNLQFKTNNNVAMIIATYGSIGINSNTNPTTQLSIITNDILPSSIISTTQLTGISSYNNDIFSGNTTIDYSSNYSGLLSGNLLSFTSSGTVTLNQWSGNLRTISGLEILNQTGGIITGTISHLAGMHIVGIYPNVTSTTISISNYYGLIINEPLQWGSNTTINNRWGIYQSSGSDLNYFNGNLLLGSNVDNGNKLQINGTASWGVGSTSIQIDNSSMVVNYAGPTGGAMSTITTGYNYIKQGASYTSPFTIATFSVMPNLVTLFEITVISDSFNSGTGTSSHHYSITKLAASMVRPYNFSSPSSVQNIIGFATQSIFQFTYDPSNAAFSASPAAYLIANTASVTLYQPVAGSGYSFRFRYEIKTTIQDLAQ